MSLTTRQERLLQKCTEEIFGAESDNVTSRVRTNAELQLAWNLCGSKKGKTKMGVPHAEDGRRKSPK